MARPRREVPPPLEGNDQLIAAIGTAVWAVALIVLVSLRNHLPPSHHWWIWTCLTGVGLGLFGVLYIPRLKKSRARAADRRSAGTADGRHDVCSDRPDRSGSGADPGSDFDAGAGSGSGSGSGG